MFFFDKKLLSSFQWIKKCMFWYVWCIVSCLCNILFKSKSLTKYIYIYYPNFAWTKSSIYIVPQEKPKSNLPESKPHTYIRYSQTCIWSDLGTLGYFIKSLKHTFFYKCQCWYFFRIFTLNKVYTAKFKCLC